MTAELGYWNLRGLCQPIRFLLEFVGDKYEEKLYGRNDGETWKKEKFTKGLILPNATHLDFMFYEALDVLHYMEPTCLDAYPNLSQFMHRIEALPKIKAYMESGRFNKWPLNGWRAYFGGGDAPPS